MADGSDLVFSVQRRLPISNPFAELFGIGSPRGQRTENLSRALFKSMKYTVPNVCDDVHTFMNARD
jgi:hypothetical protein